MPICSSKAMTTYMRINSLARTFFIGVVALLVSFGSSLPTMASGTLSATNLSAPETYAQGDRGVALTDIVVTTTNSSVTATLTLSSPSVGSLTTTTSGAVSSTFNSGTGTWTASGAKASVNSLLASVSFVPANGSYSQFTISVSIFDGTDTVTGTKPVNMPVNSAPVLDASKNPVLSSIFEDAAVPTGSVGTMVASLVDGAMPSGQVDNFSDPDSGAQPGIAITGINTSGCSAWYFYNGSSWQTLSGVSDTSALLLPASGGYRIYCRPTANFSGTLSDAITFRAWDRTAGTSGQTSDVSTNGGSSAFSSATDTASLTVVAVNDAPVLDASKTPQLSSVVQDSDVPTGAVGTLISSLVDFASPAGQVDNVSDPDTSAVTGIAVTALDTADCIAWFLYDGSSWSEIGPVAEDSALLIPANGSYRIYCQPIANFSGVISSAITFRAWDQTTGTAATSEDTTTNGDATAFSIDTDTISLSVSSSNHAPVLDVTRTPVLSSILEDAAVPSGSVGTMAASLVDAAPPAGGLDNVSDSDSGTQFGIAITALDTVNCSAWYLYDGSAWSLIGSVSESAALLIPATVSYRIYCKPVANFSGAITSAVTFRAWDQATGTAGQSADVSTNGGTTAFSAATDTASLSVSSVNDAPVLDASRNPQLNSVVEDAANPSGSAGTMISSLVDLASPAGQVDNVSDPDASALLGLAITGLDSVNCNAWYLYDGSSWSTIGSLSPTQALLIPADGGYRIYCKPVANFKGSITSAVTFRAWDLTSGTAGQTADVSTNGGSTAFSAATDTITLQVSPGEVTPENPSVTTVNVSNAKVYFAKNSSRLTRVGKAQLKSLAAKYSDADKWDLTGYVQVGGNLDNRKLSLARAKAVRSYLRSQGVVVPIAVHAGGCPKDRMSAQARRVSIKIHETVKS